MRGGSFLLCAAAAAAFVLSTPGFAQDKAPDFRRGGGGGAPPAEEEKPPEKPKTILDRVKEDAQLSKFAAALEAAGLESTLKGSGPYTLLAPNNDAFLDMDPEALVMLMKDKTKLKSLMQRHILSSKATAAALGKFANVVSVSGASHPVKKSPDGKFTIGDAKIVGPDVVGANGLVQVINKVLLPPEKPAKDAPKPVEPPTDEESK
jgi:transforming growth factor-beta-induced protein